MTDTDARPHHLYTTAQVRELDRLAIAEAGIPGYTLMTRAGEACWTVLQTQWPAARSLAVFCGAGNNGGDGFVIARLALEANWQVQLVQLGDATQMQADAQQARDAFLSAGGQVLPLTAEVAIEAELIVDALLGTGVDRPLEGLWRTAIEAMPPLCRYWPSMSRVACRRIPAM